MKSVKIGKHKVELYDAIDELPMARFHKYNKMLLIDSGIGSDMADVDRHLERVVLFINNKDLAAAQAELDNLRQNVYFIQENVSPKCLAFAVLVAKIDGKETNDLSDDGLKKTAAIINNISVGEFEQLFDTSKKKIDNELRAYFPNLFDETDAKQYADDLKKRTLAVLDTVINGKTAEKQKNIDKMTGDLLLYLKPRDFSGSNNFEIEHDKNFVKMCILLSQHLNVDPKRYTVLEYYSAYEHIQEQNQRQKASQNKGK